ncbi:MAG TPA: hypothetical protein VLJ68_05775 [Chitinophagaceae bacterium]|nr:hypothetical protein [Chitinophagaceae bacterium]
MKRFFYAVIGMICLALVSCQKAIDWNLPGGSAPGGGGNGNLVKVVQITGTDSTVTTYSYDGSKRLIEEKITGMSGGQDIGTDTKYYRNSNGIITRSVQVVNAFIPLGVDSVETRYNFNVTINRYTSTVYAITFMGFTVIDSTIFTYDGSGNVIRDEILQSTFGQPFEFSAKDEYTYSAAGNITSMKQYSFDPPTASYDQIGSYDYTFDGKTNPIRLSANKEAMIMMRSGFMNVNNATQFQFTDLTGSGQDFTSSFVYTYNSNNKPSTATMTMTPPGTIYAVTFYYQ